MHIRVSCVPFILFFWIDRRDFFQDVTAVNAGGSCSHRDMLELFAVCLTGRDGPKTVDNDRSVEEIIETVTLRLPDTSALASARGSSTLQYYHRAVCIASY